MKWMKAAWRFVQSALRRDELERGLDEEIRFHIDQQTEKYRLIGLPSDEARRRALLQFGGVEATRERTRDQFRPALIEDTWRDLRYGVRSLRRSAGFSLVSILTLAVGIGATTAVFAVVHGVLLKPLPYPEPEALVAVRHSAAGRNMSDMPISATQFFTYRDENRSFEAFGLWADDDVTVTGVTEPEQVAAVVVTHGTLQAIGVHPAIGRWFSPQDDSPGSTESVLLTHGYWQRRFAGDVSLIGRSLTIDSRPRTVIGVMPADFRFLNEKADVILPFRFDRTQLVMGAFNYLGVARLKAGVTVEQANADVARMIPIWMNAWPAPPGFDRAIFADAKLTPALRPLKQDIVGDIGNVLWVLLGTIGIVLVIACANVANLLLVRAEGRQQELAVRAALGAGWRRIARELMLESLILGLTGGAVGLGLTFLALQLLVALGPTTLPRLTEITIDPVVLTFAVAIAALSGVLFGLVPVLKHAGPHIAATLRGGGRTASDSRERHRARNVLVVVQVALALVLLVASGLMIRTFMTLRSVKPGFDGPESVQLVRITIPESLVETPEQVLRTQMNIRDRIAALPGVTAASFGSGAPLEPFVSADVLFAEDRAHADGKAPPHRRFKFVSPGFFHTLGIPVMAGRDFVWADLQQHRPVAVISENMAREMWQEPGAAVGKRIRENPSGPWREIVGVVGNVHDRGVHEPAPTTVYWLPLMKNFWVEPLLVRRSVTFAIRSSRAGTEGFVNDIRIAVWSVNGSLPLTLVRTLADVYEASLARTSFTLVMLAIAGSMALLLGIVGIYGVIAYAVSQRTREIGIRVALGAQQYAVRRMFVRHGVALASLGIVCGLAAAALTTRVLTSLLFGINPLDPATYVAVSIGLIAAAALASYIPAQRATNVDPVSALRTE